MIPVDYEYCFELVLLLLFPPSSIIVERRRFAPCFATCGITVDENGGRSHEPDWLARTDLVQGVVVGRPAAGGRAGGGRWAARRICSAVHECTNIHMD
jgi:hypothetical protein